MPNRHNAQLQASRRSFLEAATALGLSAVLPAKRAEAQSPEKRELTIGIGVDWLTSAHAIIAVEKGYFSEQGLTKVELKSFSAGLVQVEALAAGSIDISMPAQAPVLTLRSNGVPVVVLCSTGRLNDAMQLAVRHEAKITNPANLYGKKVGVLKGSTAEAMMIALARHYQLDLNRIELVNLAPPAQLSGILAGTIDAMCVWQPFIRYAQMKAPIDVVHTGSKSLFTQNSGERVVVDYTRDLVCALEAFVRSNPKTVDALVRSLARAQTFMVDPANFDEANGIFSRYQKQSPEVNALILKEYTTSIALDAGYEHDLVEVASFLSSTGRLKGKVDVREITYGEPLARVDPKLVSIPTRMTL